MSHMKNLAIAQMNEQRYSHDEAMRDLMQTRYATVDFADRAKDRLAAYIEKLESRPTECNLFHCSIVNKLEAENGRLRKSQASAELGLLDAEKVCRLVNADLQAENERLRKVAEAAEALETTMRIRGRYGLYAPHVEPLFAALAALKEGDGE